MVRFNRRQLFKASLGLAAGGWMTATRAKARDIPPVQAETAAAPLLTYNRQISSLLVRCCDLAVEQYQRSRDDNNFDGSIRELAEYQEYAALLERYTQTASFRIVELDLSSTAKIDVAAKAEQVAISVGEVFFGYALTSETSNIIALRSSQTEADWITNIAAQQVNFSNQQPHSGKVHAGFQFVYDRVSSQIRRAIEQFDPSLPCYITGYSLGSAVAVLTAANLALATHQHRLIQVYTYAGPKVGDPTFAQFYNRLVPQTYRVVNSADIFTTVPPASFDQKTYSHVGQEWSYLSQMGNVRANHAISTYRNAVDAEIEVSQSP